MTECSVTISTALDNTQLEKDLDDLKSKIEKARKDAMAPKPITFNVDVPEAEKMLKAASNYLNKVRQELSALKKQMSSFTGDRASEEFQSLADLYEQKRKYFKATQNVYYDAERKVNQQQIDNFDFVNALSSLAQMIAAGINAAVRLVCGFLDSVEPEARRIAEGI